MNFSHNFRLMDCVGSIVIVIALGAAASASEIEIPAFRDPATSDWVRSTVAPKNGGMRNPTAFARDQQITATQFPRLGHSQIQRIGLAAGSAADSRMSEFVNRCCTPDWREAGTLFRWSSNPNITGGPDLDEPLVTDRPDFTEASSTVGRGVAQIEFGYTYNYDSTAGQTERVSSWGEPLLRYGIIANCWNCASRCSLCNSGLRPAGGGGRRPVLKISIWVSRSD